MKTMFDKQETIKLIEEYYRKLEAKEVNVMVSVEKVGGFYNEECQTTIKVIEPLKIGSMTKDVETILTKDDLISKLTAILALYGFDLKNLNYVDGLSSICEGFGINERMVKKPYFNGINVELEKIKERSRGRK